MATILAFAGSNSSASINFKLVQHTVSKMEEHQVRLLDMSGYAFPMFSEDLEKSEGYSNSLVELKDEIQKADGLVLSVNEHNSNPSAFFKNVLDWLSRLDRDFLQQTKVFLMSTSPGKRGGIGALGTVEGMLPRFGGDVVCTYSLPSFYQNFDENGIVDADEKASHKAALNQFLESLS
ncbi:NAD(P)H-dependent oxidoreductase [Muricauda sp. 2012CJ35-5]|uniref:NAD(P)H-dependent oxidoreductase n=1 Tax=Flagellimonas spongiicola TaxID=2942208 RepID=A0ABT0PP87_9FLAO|nr:NAD(P)H-dependent oxidoreductase [Allomuricauda spongiicola]MCL6273194.1 NAD(P)H-dependent oxidoreductase [Allomuricauda spongiicola]